MKRLLIVAFGMLLAIYAAGRILAQFLRPIRVPSEKQIPPVRPYGKPEGTRLSSSTPSQRERPLNLNEADTPSLITLPGIGPALAELIVARRKEIGAFTSIDELTQVRGIGPKLVERLRTLVVLN